MEEYREKVERLARERSGEPFFNSSIEHAAVIVEQIFRSAKKDVCIITERLNGHVFGREEVVREAKSFLSDGTHSLKILMEEGASVLSPGHPLVEEMRRHSNVEVRKLDPSVTAKLDYHFLVMDDDSYRFEPDKNKWEAVAVFGDSKGAQNLGSIFASLWEKSHEVIELPSKREELHSA